MQTNAAFRSISFFCEEQRFLSIILYVIFTRNKNAKEEEEQRQI